MFRSRNNKNLFSFWFLGLSSDFGYWIILTAAHDLLSQGNSRPLPSGSLLKSSLQRECNQLSAGVILIVNIVPNFIMKSFLPFLPLWIHGRTFIAIILSVSGFAIASSNQTHTYMFSGVALCSIAVGIWTSSFLMYIPSFKDDKIVKAWCSGCGASGFMASMTYTILTTWGVSLSWILSFMMALPPLMAIVFWFVLEHPKINEIRQINNVNCPNKMRLRDKLKIALRLITFYTTPYFLVFFCQYLINQGLFELIYVKNSFMDLAAQVRWFTFLYLLAVLFASSFTLYKVNCLWLLVLLQIANLVILTTETIYGWIGNNIFIWFGNPYNFWIIVALIFWEGLIAGVSYVNTYRRINNEIPAIYTEFAMSINSVGASMGMTLAGLTAIPLHNYICNLPPL